MVEDDKEARSCLKEVVWRAATEGVGVLRGCWCGALQLELWALFARKARETRMGRRKMINLLTLQSIWPRKQENSLVTVWCRSFVVNSNMLYVMTEKKTGKTGARSALEVPVDVAKSVGRFKSTVVWTSRTCVVTSIVDSEPQL